MSGYDAAYREEMERIPTPASPPVSGETEEVSAKPCPDTHPDTGDPCVIPLRPSGMPHVWRHFNGKRNGKWVEWSDEWASSVRRFAISRLESRVAELTRERDAANEWGNLTSLQWMDEVESLRSRLSAVAPIVDAATKLVAHFRVTRVGGKIENVYSKGENRIGFLSDFADLFDALAASTPVDGQPTDNQETK